MVPQLSGVFVPSVRYVQHCCCVMKPISCLTLRSSVCLELCGYLPLHPAWTVYFWQALSNDDVCLIPMIYYLFLWPVNWINLIFSWCAMFLFTITCFKDRLAPNWICCDVLSPFEKQGQGWVFSHFLSRCIRTVPSLCFDAKLTKLALPLTSHLHLPILQL